MRFDIPVPCFFGNLDFCEALRLIGSLGFTAAETYNWKSLSIPDVKLACKESGVRLISMCTSEFRLTDASYRESYLDNLKQSCEAANEVGADFLITQVGQDTGEKREIQHKNIVDTLILAAPVLKNHGITLLIEPLNMLVNHKGYYLSSSQEGFEIVKEINSDNVKLVYDIYHQQVSEGNLLNNMLDNLKYIGHLHAANHPGRNDLQYGEINYSYIFSQLDMAGYSGYCGLEYNPIGNPLQSLKDFVKLFIKA